METAISPTVVKNLHPILSTTKVVIIGFQLGTLDSWISEKTDAVTFGFPVCVFECTAVAPLECTFGRSVTQANVAVVGPCWTSSADGIVARFGTLFGD